MTSNDDLERLAREVMTEPVADEIAAAYNDDVVFPHHVLIDRTDSDERSFPGWPTDVLVLATENQGVCAWGIALQGGQVGAVVVGGDLPGGIGTEVYCESVGAYVAARRWDDRCFNGTLLLEAQAAPVSADVVDVLTRRFAQRETTTGWPCATNLRFEGSGLQVMLWACADQCDWWISGDIAAIRRELPDLAVLSDLATSLWSIDETGSQLLAQYRSPRGPSSMS